MRRVSLLRAIVAGSLLLWASAAMDAAPINGQNEAIDVFKEAFRRSDALRRHTAWVGDDFGRYGIRAERLSEAELDGFRIAFARASPPHGTSFRAEVVAAKIHDVWRLRVREREGQLRKVSVYIDGDSREVILVVHAPAPYI
jgi:hypothetical protein